MSPRPFICVLPGMGESSQLESSIADVIYQLYASGPYFTLKMVVVGGLTCASLRKEALAFPVMGQQHTDGFWCAFWHVVEHGIIRMFCLSR